MFRLYIKFTICEKRYIETASTTVNNGTRLLVPNPTASIMFKCQSHRRQKYLLLAARPSTWLRGSKLLFGAAETIKTTDLDRSVYHLGTVQNIGTIQFRNIRNIEIAENIKTA